MFGNRLFQLLSLFVVPVTALGREERKERGLYGF